MARAPDFDALIIGDGLAGLAMAVSLKSQVPTFTVGLVSEHGPQSLALPWDLRVYAVARPFEQLLRESGAWEAMTHRVSQRMERMVIWDHSDSVHSSNALRFSAEDSGQSHLGLILEQADMRQALWGVAERLGVAMICSPCRDVTFSPQKATIELDAQSITAKLVIAADGRHSQLRDQLKLQWQEKRYDQTAIVAHFKTHHGHQQTAWQRFLPTGPLALLPLQKNKVSCVYSMPHGLAESWMAQPPEAFALHVTQFSDQVLGELTADSERASFSLRFARLNRYCAHRIAFIGDSAHVVHPLAGQGINQGVADVLALTRVLSDAHGRGLDVGEWVPLADYSRCRSAENEVMGASIDGLYEWFRSDVKGLQLARRFGFRALNQAPFLKALLVQQAMGVS